MGGAVTWVWRNGSRLTPWMLYIITLIDAEMWSLFGVRLLVSSGIRTYEEQVAIFLSRYVTAGRVNGRRVYDTRVWNGTRYYRISSAGTVAVPSTSNHEIQGSRAAVDLRDNGSDSGVATAGSRRSNWLRANAARFGLVASGFGFSEAWHYDVLNIFNTPPVDPTPPVPVVPEPTLEDLMSGLKSAVIFTAEGDRNAAAALDFETGFVTQWQSNGAYARGVASVISDGGNGGMLEVTSSHFDKLVGDFAKFFAEKREHELQVARASAGV